MRMTPATAQTLGLKKRKGLSVRPLVDKTWRSAFSRHLANGHAASFPGVVFFFGKTQVHRKELKKFLAGTTTKKIEKGTAAS